MKYRACMSMLGLFLLLGDLVGNTYMSFWVREDYSFGMIFTSLLWFGLGWLALSEGTLK